MPSTILFVDDDTALLDALRRGLRSQNWRTTFCRDAEQALTALAEQRVDVLVSDERMPGLHGTELLTEVRRSRPEVVTIMMSGAATPGTITRAINDGGIFRFLIKPVATSQVIAAVRQALAYKAVLDGCQMLLARVRAQRSALIALLPHGDIRSGPLLAGADEAPFPSLEELAAQITTELAHSERMIDQG